MKKIIFDTDIGGDCDDVLALDVLMSCDRAKECKLLGVAYSAQLSHAIGCTYAIMERHGYGHLPISKAEHPKNMIDYTETRSYAYKIDVRFKNENTPDYDKCEYAVHMYRRLLAENENVTIVLTGWLTNLAALLKSEPDEFSPLSGVELVREKVDEVAMIAGNFSHETGYAPYPERVGEDGAITPDKEANINSDVPASKYVFENCPVPITVLPSETGYNIISGGPMCRAGYGVSPDSLSFSMVNFEDGRHSWDPATALYGVFGNLPWFYRTNPGVVRVDDDGYTYFTSKKDGMHSILYCAMPKPEIAKEIDRISMRLFE
ncbi:MAG: nucleoside hydrolase [Firmicutes bacterium]|nr:nucleoside hydrolase [Bacillota bacterium]